MVDFYHPDAIIVVGCRVNSQKAMGELFDCSTDNISLHLKKYMPRMN